VADGWGYPRHETDFGMAMASWGVPPGPFLYLPMLGPTDPRDAVGFGVDMALDPLTWVGTGQTVSILDWTRFGVSVVDARERVLEPMDEIKKTALDPYGTYRSLYRQHRQGQIDKMRNDNRATVPVWFAQPATPAH
jgi:phospholipid-binding lipoprotein MlaA